MELYVDDHKTSQTANSGTLHDIVDAAKSRAARDGRIVVGVACDGIDVTGDDWAATLARPTTDFARIDLQTAAPAALIGDAIQSAGHLLTEADQAAAEAADHLAAGRTNAAMPRLGACCQTWLEVHRAIRDSIALLNLNANDIQIEGRNLDETARIPLERLREIKLALETRDFVTLADILTYELPAAVTTWRSMLEAIASKAHSAPLKPSTPASKSN